MDFNFINTIKCLTLFELPTDKPVTDEIIRSQYRKLCLIYHPDQSNARYKDGTKFKELTEAKDYLTNNITAVNAQISSGFQQSSRSNSYNNQRDYAEEARRRAEYEARRRAEEEARRRAAEEARRRAEEEARRRAEEEARRRAEEEAMRKSEEAQRKAAAEKAESEAKKNNASKSNTTESLASILKVFIVAFIIVAGILFVIALLSAIIPTNNNAYNYFPVFFNSIADL